MADVPQPVAVRILYFPKCPYNRPVLQWILRVALLVLGALGLSFLNFWAAVVYVIYYGVFFFWAMPVKHCQYCYYCVTDPTIDSKTGTTRGTLLPLDQWKESHFPQHVECAKKWEANFFILWFLPIGLMGIGLFLNFSIVAVIALIAFIVVLAAMLLHMKWKVCPTCAFMEECHASF
jgi:membrane protein YdbS with pleckstrin-like domain